MNEHDENYISKNTIQHTQLEPGDVIVTHTKSKMGRIIRLLDGDFGHAALVTTSGNVVHMGDVVVEQPITALFDTEHYDHSEVLRFPDLTPEQTKSILTAAQTIVKNKTEYARDDLALAAILVIVNPLGENIPGWICRMVKSMVDDRTMKNGFDGERMMCSEMVIRCFAKAGLDTPILRGFADRDMRSFSERGAALSSDIDPTEFESFRQELAPNEAIEPDATTFASLSVALTGSVAGLVTGERTTPLEYVAQNFVSPSALWRCKAFDHVGKLEPGPSTNTP
jgi:hypothetical protein